MNDSLQNVRVRFAPSPTGYLHVGGARTAIFNWLWAKHNHGTFVVRVEDTDVERSTAESEKSLLQDLRWLGLEWDEGPDVDGEFGPYRQSDRMQTYRDYSERLINDGRAYPCFCREEDLEVKRKQAAAEGRAPQYDGSCRDLDSATIDARRAEGIPEVIRFRVPEGKVVFDDVVRGQVEMETSMVGDFVVLRSNSLPTYNFAATIDDHLMKISHVIRGEEHLSNTLRQILIYDALGAPHPRFVHVPLILAEDRSKLSKRHGASSVEELRAAGFLASAAFNYLVLLGWSHPQSEEVLTIEELISSFTIDRIGRAPAVFDRQKLVWMNGQHIRRLEPNEFYEHAAARLPGFVIDNYSESSCREIVAVLQDSVETLDDLDKLAAVFDPDVAYEEEAKEVLADPVATEVLDALRASLVDLGGDLTPETFKMVVKAVGKELGRKGKEVFFPIRAAVTGSIHGPDLSHICSIKGKDAVIASIDRVLS